MLHWQKSNPKSSLKLINSRWTAWWIVIFVLGFIFYWEIINLFTVRVEVNQNPYFFSFLFFWSLVNFISWTVVVFFLVMIFYTWIHVIVNRCRLVKCKRLDVIGSAMKRISVIPIERSDRILIEDQLIRKVTHFFFRFYILAHTKCKIGLLIFHFLVFSMWQKCIFVMCRLRYVCVSCLYCVSCQI